MSNEKPKRGAKLYWRPIDDESAEWRYIGDVVTVEFETDDDHTLIYDIGSIPPRTEVHVALDRDEPMQNGDTVEIRYDIEDSS